MPCNTGVSTVYSGPSSITNRQETDTKENDESNNITFSSKNNTTGVSTEERVLLEEGVAIDLDSEEVTINIDDDVPICIIIVNWNWKEQQK